VIPRIWRAVVGLLGSAGLAVGLLLFVTAWSTVATFIPQGDATLPAVAMWARANPTLESIAGALGLHHAFGAPAFLIPVLILGLSTALCAWRRTRVAGSRTSLLRSSRRVDAASLSTDHDFAIAIREDMDAPEAQAAADAALAGLGIRARFQGGVLRAVSTPLSPWGSAVFHWALVALLALVLLGQAVRAEGSMALAVGETKPDAQESYISVTSGPWHDWARIRRGLRVDAFEPALKVGGIDRGAVPTVSVLDRSGKVLEKQRVYPNMMLHSGSLSISAPRCGLAAELALLDPAGNETGRLTRYVDFSQVATEGTTPLGVLSRSDPAGSSKTYLAVTVPLDRSGNGFGEWIPKDASVRVTVMSVDGGVLLNQVIKPGEGVVLPGGEGLGLVGIRWYSRLSVVDDPTVPFVYGAMVVALIGLAVSLLARQQVLVGAVVDTANGRQMIVRARLWRNSPTTRRELENTLNAVLSGAHKADETRSTL